MTLDQTRAQAAFAHVSRVHELPEKERNAYGATALKLPALVRAAGLCQALHFVHSRGGKGTDLLLDHLGAQLNRMDARIQDSKSLCERVREAPLVLYLQLTREAVATLGWYARLVQSELNIERTQEDSGE